MSDSTEIIPVNSVLQSLLNEAAESAPNFGTTVEYAVNDEVQVVQSKGERHDISQVMKLYVGGKDVSQGVYVKEISFILVDTLYDTIMDGKYTKNRGGRQIWDFVQEDGKWRRAKPGETDTQGPACKSSNGVQPRPEFLGKELVDVRTGEFTKIGFELADNGEYIPMTETVPYLGEQHISVCAKCPLGQWRTDPVSGAKQPPPCGDAWGYVVYILPDSANGIEEGKLAVIRGNNLGVQMALPGARAGSPAARQDGAAFMGIVAPFKANPNTRNKLVTRRVGEVAGKGIMDIIGFCENEAQAGFVAAKMRLADGSVNPLFAQLRNNNDAYPYVVLSVPTYPYAPEGLPEEAGLDAKVKRVGMRVAKNGYKLGSAANATLVPEIFIKDDTLTIEEYTGYIAARSLYKATDARASLMRFDLLKVVDEALSTGIMPAPSQDTASQDTLEV